MEKQEFFYTAEPIEKRVSKDEFEQYIANYPRKLEYDAFGACDPPYITYNDFELANCWPYSVVASTHVYDDNPGHHYYMPEEERVYTIVENYEELFNSKTGNKAEWGGK